MTNKIRKKTREMEIRGKRRAKEGPRKTKNDSKEA